MAKVKSAGVAARASRMVLPEMMEGVLTEEEDFAAAFGQGFEAVEFGLGRGPGGRDDDGLCRRCRSWFRGCRGRL